MQLWEDACQMPMITSHVPKLIAIALSLLAVAQMSHAQNVPMVTIEAGSECLKMADGVRAVHFGKMSSEHERGDPGVPFGREIRGSFQGFSILSVELWYDSSSKFVGDSVRTDLVLRIPSARLRAVFGEHPPVRIIKAFQWSDRQYNLVTVLDRRLDAMVDALKDVPCVSRVRKVTPFEGSLDSNGR